MTNDYFNHVDNRVSPNTRALDTQINAIADEVAAGFDKIPDEQDLRGDVTNLATNTGTAAAMIAALSYTPSLTDGFQIYIRTADQNAASATLNLNSLGIKPILNSDLTPISQGAMAVGSIKRLYYDQISDAWVLGSNNSSDIVGLVPPGGIAGDLLIKQSSATGDYLWQDGDIPILPQDSIMYPGYDYTYQSNTTFTVDLVDAEALFKNGRRIRFESAGGAYTFGVISAQDYDSTHANDTFVTVVMEAGAVPNPIANLALVSDTANWSPIAEDPFGGTRIYDIATGVIDGTQWWMIVGLAGRVAYSTNKGLNWTVATPTSEDLRCVSYDAFNGRFVIGGGDGYLVYTTDGVTFTDHSSIISGLFFGTGDIVAELDYSSIGENIALTRYDISQGLWYTYQSDDGGSGPWDVAFGSGRINSLERIQQYVQTHPSGPPYWFYVTNNSDPISYQYEDHNDTSGSISITLMSNITAGWFGMFNGNDQNVIGAVNGTIRHTRDHWSNNESEDATTFVGIQINDFAFSNNRDRMVCVGNEATIGYLSQADWLAEVGNGAWTSVSNGFAPTAKVVCLERNESDDMFVACADNGQICRSSSGIS